MKCVYLSQTTDFALWTKARCSPPMPQLPMSFEIFRTLSWSEHAGTYTKLRKWRRTKHASEYYCLYFRIYSNKQQFGAKSKHTCIFENVFFFFICKLQMHRSCFRKIRNNIEIPMVSHKNKHIPIRLFYDTISNINALPIQLSQKISIQKMVFLTNFIRNYPELAYF